MAKVTITLEDESKGIEVEVLFSPSIPMDPKDYTDAQRAGAIMLESLHQATGADPKAITVEVTKHQN